MITYEYYPAVMPDGSPKQGVNRIVFLDGQEQIKAVWQDGKVVRVYHKGTIDDLSQSQFASTGGRNFETYFWLLLCFIAIPLIVVILNRLNRKKKQQPGFRSIP